MTETKKYTSLSKTERQQLANQFRILERLSEDSEAKDFARYAEIFERGYTFLYDDVFEHLWEELPAEISKEVIDILDMYRALHDSVQRLPAQEKAEFAAKVKFGGFDGNNESQHLSFAHFFCDEEKRFEESHIHNSHHQTLPNYRSQLQKWKELKKPHIMTRDQVEQLIAAYPLGTGRVDYGK